MSHADQAVELFKTGMNCAQAVFCAFAGDFGMDAATAEKVSAGLGGGVGRQREVCGAVTGAALALGLKFGPDKNGVYAHVQNLSGKFKEACGSIVCHELLAGTGATRGGAAEARTPEFYRKRPCAELVRLAAELCAAELARPS
ncbi:MAG: C-GCAxxG-C-C family protein [Kiritimatiellia bacterium]